MLLDELFALRKADKEERDRFLEKLDRMTEQLMNLNENSQHLLRQNEEQQKIILDLNELIEKLQKENAKRNRIVRICTGLKASRFPVRNKKKEEALSHEENKYDFNVTSGF